MASSARSQINNDVNANASSGKDAEPKVDFGFYLPLYKAALRGDWNTADAFFHLYPDALEARIDPSLDTALHIAVAKTSRSGLHFVKKLTGRMFPEALTLTGSRDQTALAIAAQFGNVEAAKLLVSKNPDLLPMRDWEGELPLQKAARFGHREMLVYLLEVTKDDMKLSLFKSESGVYIVRHIIFAGFYGVPIEACSNGLFDGATVSRRAIGSRGQMQMGNLLHVLAEKCITLAPQMRRIRDLKMKHRQSLQLIKFLCKEAADLDYKRAESIMRAPLFYAVKNGILEIVEEIVEAFPLPVRFLDGDQHHNIFQISVLHRRETVFNLLYQMDQPTSMTTFWDKSGKNILHLAGGLAPSHRLSRISGAALQMQRELQWFEEHKELVIEGEKWMKDTANSCSLVAALIATVMFAAAITVPGGNSSDTGYPVFRIERAFTVFAVFDALSLFSSSASILMFLSILTARYAESDFLYALPKRLVIGLSTLFLSIAFMMAAFSAALYLVFGNNRAWVLAAVVAFASIPVTLFVTLQFPLLVDMIYWTYGPGIFGKQSKRPFY